MAEKHRFQPKIWILVSLLMKVTADFPKVSLQLGGGYLNTTRNFRSYLVLNSQCSLKRVSIINSAISTSVIFIYDLQEVKKKLAKKHSTVREWSNLPTPSTMAPAGMELRCTKGGCQFITPDMELPMAMDYLKLHQTNEHSQQLPQVSKSYNAVKPKWMGSFSSIMSEIAWNVEPV